MIDRYLNREIFTNSQDMYTNLFSERKIKLINHYETPTFVYPDKNNIKNVNLIKHYWSVGDRYYKLANTYYGDPKDWWIIAKFNNKPTESHLSIGDLIYIPTPLQSIIEIMRG